MNCFFSTSGSRSARGFTLIELLAVVAIIAILVALLFPTVGSILNESKRAKCAFHLRAIGGGIVSYASEEEGSIPIGYGAAGVWTTLITPYMPWTIFGNRPSDDSRYCPTTSKEGVGIYKRNRATWNTDYGVNDRILVPGGYARQRKVTTVPSNVFTVFDGNQMTHSPAAGVYLRHKNRVNVLFLDGHVETLNEMPPTSDPRWGPAWEIL